MDGLNDLELLGSIDEKYIDSARKAGRAKRGLRIALPIAAGLCLALICGALISRLPYGGEKREGITAINSPAPKTAADPTENGAEIPEDDKLYLGLCRGMEDDMIGSEPVLEWGIDYEMFIYGGRVYFKCITLDPLADVMGEKLGTVEPFEFAVAANACVDEELGSPSAEEDHPYIRISENELKGTAAGNIYAVKGYDPAKLLCMRDGVFGKVKLFIHDGGITEANGAAYLENVMHASEQLGAFRYFSNLTRADSIGAAELELGPDSREVRLFIEALDEAAWADDTRNFYSRAFSDAETSPYQLYSETDPGFFMVTLALNNDVDIVLTVYRDGLVSFPYSFNSRALRIDPEKLRPLWELMKTDAGTSLGFRETERLAECRRDERFGGMVPELIPAGYHIRRHWIDRITDPDTGAVTGTDHIRIEYKNPNGALINLWIRPIEQKDSDYSIRCGVQKGARIVEKAEFGESCMYKAYGHNAQHEVYTISIVTYRDAVIFIEAFDTEPQTVIDLINSIGG